MMTLISGNKIREVMQTYSYYFGEKNEERVLWKN